MCFHRPALTPWKVTSWKYAEINIYSHLQALSKDIFIHSFVADHQVCHTWKRNVNICGSQKHDKIIVTKKITFWPIWPTTRECVHLDTRGRFRLRDKDGGHTIRSAMTENPMLHACFFSLCFMESELISIEIYIEGIKNFKFLCSCDLRFNPMTFIYEACQKLS